MSDKKVIVMLCIVIVFIIILMKIIINLMTGDTESETTIKKKYPEKDREYQRNVEQVEKGKVTGKYETSVKNADYYNLKQEGRNLVDKRIDYVLYLLNARDVDTMYSMFSNDYKRALYPTVADLKKYLDKKFPEDAKYIAKSFEVYENGLFFDVATEAKSTTITTIFLYNYNLSEDEEEYTEEGFENKMVLYLADISSIDGVRFQYYNNLVRLDSSYSLSYFDHYALVVDITNKTDEEITIDFDGTKLVEEIGSRENRYSMVTTRYVTIPAHETVKYEMGFRMFKISPNRVELHMKIGDKTIVASPSIVEQSIDDD